MKKIVLLVSILFLLSIAMVFRFVNPVVAQETIYIRDDGRVDPETAPIYRDGNVYTFTDNIYDEIVIQRDNIVVNGAGYILQETGKERGIDLSGRSNVSIQNMYIREFKHGIYMRDSSNNNIYGNTITNNDRGIYLRGSSNNNVYGNTITNNQEGIYFYAQASSNIFYHNNFIDNEEQVELRRSNENVWDDGHPSGGNYWNDYLGSDGDGDGIGDIPYFIDYFNNIDRYPLMNPWIPPPDTTPPIVSIISPENKTYSVTEVPLTFTVSEFPSWIGYSLDNQANMTIYGNTILIGLSDGSHTITVYASDAAGNTGRSDTIHFTIDTVAPDMEIVSPENKTYSTNSVSLIFTVNEPTSWIGYSLDGQANYTITGDIILTELYDGKHSLIVYASDMLGNMGSSEMVYFTVDTSLPSITILSPENRTYDTTAVLLSFTVDESVSWMAYSLDGQTNVTITGNTTLTLLDGMHYIVVYANDIANNMGVSSMVYFTVDSEAPTLSLISPTNTSYASTSVPLSFVVYGPASWIGYSLDGQMNVTVSGNTTIVGLSDGIHTIRVYANDTTGNMGSSSIIYFTVDTTLPDTTLPTASILSPANKTYTVTDVPLTFTVSESASWIGYSLDGQANMTITGNTTLTGLSDGTHSLVVYARDLAENLGSSSIVYFTIDTTLSPVSVLSPENRTYDTTDVLLSCTVDESVSWMAYSLDGQTNVTITGDTTLSGLSKGLHSLVVYVRDTAGNTGASEVVHFTIEPQQPGPTQLWIVALITVIAGAGFAFTGYLAYDLLKTTTRHGPKNRVKRTS